MCVLHLIVFTDKYQGHVRTLHTEWFFITFKLYPNTCSKPVFVDKPDNNLELEGEGE